ncbi:hypothetical protein [Ramlibacter alkalitolerans]|uniref:MatE family transporter n=1 Tax=Ramlibacter alkalitolerans TaxID=2039631 RepID=A0ABS1JK81_9BURK|nr:hypothetical protein [Ramlibacter alkalitolerans]MBL0424200.1 hypothetical protein [Ramlibacter alkalitolerans]
MPYIRTPAGITPPTPGLEHEEPEFMASEEDIPGGDTSASAVTDRNAPREDPLHTPERE